MYVVTSFPERCIPCLSSMKFNCKLYLNIVLFCELYFTFLYMRMSTQMHIDGFSSSLCRIVSTGVGTWKIDAINTCLENDGHKFCRFSWL